MSRRDWLGEASRAVLGVVSAVLVLLATAVGLAGKVERLPNGSGAADATISGTNDNAPPGPGDSSGFGGSAHVLSSALPEDAEALPPPSPTRVIFGRDPDGGISPGHRDRVERPPRIRV